MSRLSASVLSWNKPRIVVASPHVARPDSRKSPPSSSIRSRWSRSSTDRRSEGPGPLLVIAGAGSGKTKMLAHRVAHLILAGADPKRIMLATFSRRAAAELNRRVERLLAAPSRAGGGGRARRRPMPARSTPSARGSCANMRPRLGLDPQFTIHDREDSADLMNWARHAAGLSETPTGFRPRRRALRSIPASSTRAPNSADARQMVSLGRGARGGAARDCSRLMSKPSSARTCSITTTCCSISRRCSPSPRSPAEIAGRFDHLLVDEYQDTNALQAEIVLALRPRGRGLTVVGDDAQSIYSFRAATVRNISIFPTRSIRPRASSRSSATTARPRRSSPPPTP